MTDSRLADKFVIRLPDGMRDQIKAEASRAFISMNPWIVQAIAEKLDRDKRANVAVDALVEQSGRAKVASSELRPAVIMRIVHKENEVMEPEILATNGPFDDLAHGTELRMYAGAQASTLTS